MVKNKQLILLIGLFGVYFLLRLINLTALPIFNDESTYIRYGIHQLNEPDHRPYSLLIGKEPLLPYLYASIGTMFGNLLVGARFVTIVFGFFTLVGLYLFTNEVLGKKVALFSSLFYIITPYAVFFDRLALLDSPVSTIAIWTLYLTNRILNKPQWRYAIALGVVMGLGLWTKSSTLFYIFLPAIAYCLYYYLHRDAHGRRLKMFAGAVILSLIIFLPLYTNPFYQELLVLNGQYTYPLYSIFLFPFSVWWTNISEMFSWLFFYLTPPLFLLAFASVVIFFKEKKVQSILLWLFLPMLYEILYAKLFTSRHTLLLTIPLFILAGYGLSTLWQKRKIFAYVILGICLIWSLSYDFVLMTNPQQYPSLFLGSAENDATQYVHGFSSGYGVLEAVNYLEEQAQNNRIIVLIRDDHGNPEDAMVAYLDYKSNIIILPMDNPQADVPIVFKKIGTTSIPVYFVSRGAYYAGLEKYFASEKRFLKPYDTEFVGVERLKPL